MACRRKDRGSRHRTRSVASRGRIPCPGIRALSRRAFCHVIGSSTNAEVAMMQAPYPQLPAQHGGHTDRFSHAMAACLIQAAAREWRSSQWRLSEKSPRRCTRRHWQPSRFARRHAAIGWSSVHINAGFTDYRSPAQRTGSVFDAEPVRRTAVGRAPPGGAGLASLVWMATRVIGH
jgi:hypothetical protein